MAGPRRTVTAVRTLLDRTLRLVTVAVIIVGIGFAVRYALDRRIDTGPDALAQAIVAAEGAVRATPADAAMRVTLANLYLERGRLAEADTQYAAALEIDETFVPAHRGLGLLRLEQKRFADATGEWRRVIDTRKGGEFSPIDRQLEEAYYYLARAQLAEDPRDAITSLEEALRIDRTDADAWVLLGTARLAVNDPPAAALAYGRAVALVPNYREAYTGLADAYRAASDADGVRYAEAMVLFTDRAYERAASELRGLVDAAPRNAAAWTGLGLVYEELRRKDDAVEAFRRALAADPAGFNARAGLARLGMQP